MANNLAWSWEASGLLKPSLGGASSTQPLAAGSRPTVAVTDWDWDWPADGAWLPASPHAPYLCPEEIEKLRRAAASMAASERASREALSHLRLILAKASPAAQEARPAEREGRDTFCSLRGWLFDYVLELYIMPGQGRTTRPIGRSGRMVCPFASIDATSVRTAASRERRPRVSSNMSFHLPHHITEIRRPNPQFPQLAMTMGRDPRAALKGPSTDADVLGLAAVLSRNGFEVRFIGGRGGEGGVPSCLIISPPRFCSSALRW